MNLESIATYLEENELGKAGQTIFVNRLPAPVSEGILLLPPYGGVPIDHYMPGYHRSDFRLVVRSPDYARALQLATACSAVLNRQSRTLMGDLVVTQCLPRNLPRPYRNTEGDYVEMEVEIDIWFHQQIA